MLRNLAILTLVLAGVLPQLAQNHPPFPPPPPITTMPDASGARRPPTPDEIRRKKAMEKALAHQRFLEMQRDTDRLFSLATDLKKEVDAAGQDTLSLDVIKKAETIEKLAKSVKQRMKGD
jgi:hypothetical protein